MVDSNQQPSDLPKTETGCCGPGCDCGKPAGGKGIKTAVSLLVVAALIGILGFKTLASKNGASDTQAGPKASAFSVAQAEPKDASEAVGPASKDIGENKSVENAGSKVSAVESAQTGAVAAVQPEPQKNETETKPAGSPAGIGEKIESFNDLNRVAMDKDAVFVFIPTQQNEAVPSQTSAAVLAAQQSLNRSKIKFGLYTLSTGSPDYANVVKQAQPPLILVASKGRGMRAVTGDVTENKLLQAFMSLSSAGGCCSAKGGTAGASCK